MKKTYTKPQLLLERFALTQMLSSCGTLIGSTDSNCVLNDGDATSALKDFALFGWFMGGCTIVWEGDDIIDGICTHLSSNLMFTS